MRVERTLTITTTGVLTITVTPSTPRSYVDQRIEIHVTGDGMAVGPFDVRVDWGDGVVDSFYEPMGFIDWRYSHTYGAAGTYTITVTVTDETTLAEGSGSATQEIRAVLTVSLSADKTTGPVPLTVTFTCEARGGYLNYSWTLDPGDGSAPYSGTRTAEGTWTVTHTYTKVGTFTAKLTVTDAVGGTLSAEVSLGPGVEIPPEWIAGVAALFTVIGAAVAYPVVSEELRKRGLM